jgi:hypothetical protein
MSILVQFNNDSCNISNLDFDNCYYFEIFINGNNTTENQIEF